MRGGEGGVGIARAPRVRAVGDGPMKSPAEGRRDPLKWFSWLICALAATLPLDSLLGGYDPIAGEGFRSASFYVGVVATFVGLLCLPSMARAFVRAGALVLMFGSFVIALLILIVGMLTDGLPIVNNYGVDKPFKALFMACLFVWAAQRPGWRRRLMHSYLVGWGVFLGVSLGLLVAGQVEVVQAGEESRRSLMQMNVNVQSILAASGSILLLGHVLSSRRLLTLVAAVVALGGGVAMFALGSSRTGVAAGMGGLGVLVIGVIRARDRPSLKEGAARVVLLAVGLAVSAAVVAGHESVIGEALDSLSQRTTAAIEGTNWGSRDVLAWRTWEIFLRNPMGVGLGRTWDVLEMDPHNGYLKMLAEGGIVGFALLLAALVMAGRSAARLMNSLQEVPIVAVFVLFSIAALFGQALVESPYWLFFALVITPSRPLGSEGTVRPAALTPGFPVEHSRRAMRPRAS